MSIDELKLKRYQEIKELIVDKDPDETIDILIHTIVDLEVQDA